MVVDSFLESILSDQETLISMSSPLLSLRAWLTLAVTENILFPMVLLVSEICHHLAISGVLNPCRDLPILIRTIWR